MLFSAPKYINQAMGSYRFRTSMNRKDKKTAVETAVFTLKSTSLIHKLFFKLSLVILRYKSVQWLYTKHSD
ncbi:hypothetical protein DYC54_17200 [Vibrio cholerae]|nr:hypothetical protein [Vibrio cholerae]